MQIQTSAPGKLVLSGEYVVLQGAPALVLALNSRAKCTFEANEAKGWQIHSLPSNHTEIVEMSSRSIDTTLGSLHELIDFMQPLDRVPENAKLKLDTSDFFEHQHKLGLGSSAALVVALGALIDSLRDTHTPFETLRRIHNQMQKSCGSGLDVAASLVGGAIKFQEGQYHSVSLPDGLCFCFVFAGTSTNTTEMVQRFSKILTETHDQGIVAAWRQSASETANSLKQATDFLRAVRGLAELLYRFDQSEKLGIFGPQHQTAYRLADQLDLVYKPCGAGGGDMGVALGIDAGTFK